MIEGEDQGVDRDHAGTGRGVQHDNADPNAEPPRSKSLLMLVVIEFIESETRFGGLKKLIVNFSTH